MGRRGVSQNAGVLVALVIIIAWQRNILSNISDAEEVQSSLAQVMPWCPQAPIYITWANVDQDLCHHRAFLWQNGKKYLVIMRLSADLWENYVRNIETDLPAENFASNSNCVFQCTTRDGESLVHGTRYGYEITSMSRYCKRITHLCPIVNGGVFKPPMNLGYGWLIICHNSIVCDYLSMPEWTLICQSKWG